MLYRKERLFHIWPMAVAGFAFILKFVLMPPYTKYIYILPIFLLGLWANGLRGQTVLRQAQEPDKADSLKKAGNYAEELKVYQGLMKADSIQGNIKDLCKDYNNIANVYQRMGLYDKSTLFYFKALKIAEEIKDKKLIGAGNYGVGMNYALIGDNDNAIIFINKAVDFFTEQKSTSELANAYLVLGNIFQSKKLYDKAMSYFKRAEEIFKAENNKEYLANTYVTVSNMELERGDFKFAMEYARKSLLLFKEVNDKLGIATSYVNLQVALYYQNENPDKPDYNKEMQNCITLLDSAYLAVKNINTPEHFLHIYQNKAELYNLIGKNDSAYFYLQKHQILNDSIYSATKDKQIQELKIQYEADKKEQNILLLEKENARQTILIIAAFTSAGFVTALLLLIVVRNRSRKKQKQTEFEKSVLEFEQQALRAQMNPHFIFNAISSIQKYILKKDKQEAYDYLAKFAKLIRIVLNNSQQKELLLQQELEMIKLYIELEQLRFSNSFAFNLTVQEEINEIEIAVPAMLIQPYIENAIWHGLMNLPAGKAGLENERKGVLKVDISQTENVLKICIEDNGIGRDKAKQYKREDKHRSVGMALTEQRLLMINKMQEYENAKVTVADLYFDDKTPAGTRVEIYIPVK